MNMFNNLLIYLFFIFLFNFLHTNGGLSAIITSICSVFNYPLD